MLNQKIGKCLVVLIFLMLLVFSIDESYVESAGSVQDEAGENADIGQEKMTTGSDSTEQNEALGNAGTGQDEMTAESDGTGLKKIEKSSDTGQNKKIKKVSLKKDELLTIIDDLNTDEKEFYSSSEELLNSKEVKKVKKIQEALYENGSRASFLLVDLNSGEVFSSGTEHIYYGASVLKGPFVVAVNKYDPDSVNDYIKEMMTYAIEMSDNQCYDNLRMTYGVDVLAKLVEDTGASQTVVDAYNWYPDMTVKDLAKLWVGMYWYFFEE
ncbi:MAG: hypothetical protein J5983_01780, partial [Ruminococcus sp.]|nr:hypothetical protein [Ruminococcus sp.]